MANKKKYQLQNIDDFIKDFNKLKLGKLKRTSNDSQENPDAICQLDNKEIIGLEATTVTLPVDLPNADRSKHSPFYNPYPILDLLIETIKKKSLNDYKDGLMSQVWLLISGGSFISDIDLEEKIKGMNLNTRFDRIYIHKGTGGKILWLIPPKSKN